MAVAEEAEVPDAVKPVRQHMDQKAPDELLTREGHYLLAVVISVILPAEADLAVIHGHQSVVGNGDAMSVAPDVVENLGRARERPLRVDHPPGVVGRRQMTAERRGLMQLTIRGEEVQLTSSKCLVQIVQEQSSKQARQHLDRKKVSVPGRDPTLPVGCNPAARYKKMQMRMMGKRLSPG